MKREIEIEKMLVFLILGARLIALYIVYSNRNNIFFIYLLPKVFKK